MEIPKSRNIGDQSGNNGKIRKREGQLSGERREKSGEHLSGGRWRGWQ